MVLMLRLEQCVGRVRDLAGMRVRSWVMRYIDESPHKNRNTRVRVFRCGDIFQEPVCMKKERLVEISTV